MPKESTLSTTAAAHNNNCLTPVNVKRNVIDNRAVSEFSDEAFDFDDGRISGHGRNDE
jgi:hypothetical protein